MKKIPTLFIFYLGLYLTTFGQNLVPNPSFEDLKAIPCSWVNEDDFRRIYAEWFQPTGGTTDVLSTYVDSTCYASCYSIHPESNGYKTPRTGNVLTVILTAGRGCQDYNYREYLGIKLKELIIPQKTYYAEMYISLTDSSRFATNNIGMLFSKDSIAEPYYCKNLGIEPQINSDSVVTVSKGWVKISGYFKVVDSSQFLYIGNMYAEEETIIQEVNPKAQFNTRYFVDDVLVRPCLSASPDTLICRGDSVTLRAWGSPVYGWADIKEPEVFLSEDSILKVSPITTTQYYIYSICDTLSVTVTVPEQLKDTALCLGDSMNIPLNYQNDQTYDDTGSSIWISTTGEYIISRAFPYCIQTDTFTISHKPLPILDLGVDLLICKIDTILLDVSSPGVKVKWDNHSIETKRIITEPGLYTVQGWLDGCFSENSIHIELEECYADLIMPNVFTPNNDQINDLFTPIKMEGIVYSRVSIINRYGVSVFASNSIHEYWDGMINGQPAPAGIYFYSIQIFTVNGEFKDIKGSLSLLR